MKQVLLVRTDLGMSVGKAIAQASHVSLLASREAADPTVDHWLENDGKKITLAVESKTELEHHINQAKHFPTATIADKGYTELEPGTVTAGAIGPANEHEIDDITGNLPLYTH